MTDKGKEIELNAEKLSRNSKGLLESPPIGYVFNEDGSVDWRKMVRREYLVANKQRTNETDVSLLEDRDLLILLGGIKELAQIRGYTDVTYVVVSPTPDYVVATCTITWLPNFETEGHVVTFSAIGDASPNNTKDFAKHFLGPIAENRAFVRCVRNFLRINIVAQEELGSVKFLAEENQASQTDPKTILMTLMKEKGLSFEIIKNKLVKEGYDNANGLGSIGDIPKIKVFELIERLKKAKTKKTKLQ